MWTNLAVEEGRKRSDAWPSTGGGGMGVALGNAEAHVAKVFRAVVMGHPSRTKG